METNDHVKDVDYGWDKMSEWFDDFQGGKAVDVGLFTSEGTDQKVVGLHSARNEFGDPDANIPKRKHHRPAFDNNFEEYAALIDNEIQKGPEADLMQVLEDIARLHRYRIEDVVINKESPPNAPFTIEKKGFDDPLIETLTMVQEFTWRWSE
jgi:hypothetical protein